MRILYLNLFLFFFQNSFAQKITYATEGNLSSPKTNFEILAKINGKYLIHIGHLTYSGFSYDNLTIPRMSPLVVYNFPWDWKYDPSTFRSSSVYVYDNEMRLVSKEKLKLPKEYFGIHFIAYPKFVYMFYQYMKYNRIFCMALKIDSTGKMNGEPLKIAEIKKEDYYSTASIYNIAYSEDKSKIAIFAIQENDRTHAITLRVLNQSLKIIKKENYEFPRMSNHETFSDFNIDNNGNFVFLKKDEFDNADPYKYALNYIQFDSTNLSYYNITPLGIKLNFPIIKIDNTNKKISFYSFYSDSSQKVLLSNISLSKAADMTGLFRATWDCSAKTLSEAEVLPFSGFIGKYANDPDFTNLPIQNFVLSAVYPKSSGAFVLEAANNFSNYYSNLYTISESIWEKQARLEKEYLNFNNYDVFLLSRLSQNLGKNTILLSFNEAVALKKFTFISDPEAAGFMTMRTSDGIHYLLIHNNRNQFSITHLMYTGGGEVQIMAPIKNIGDHEIISTGSKQVSAQELIFAVSYNHKKSFAKIEF